VLSNFAPVISAPTDHYIVSTAQVLFLAVVARGSTYPSRMRTGWGSRSAISTMSADEELRPGRNYFMLQVEQVGVPPFW
jgi:hypothetical protein